MPTAHDSPSPLAPKRRGSVLVYTMIAMTGLMAICSLGVDLGVVQLSKTELRNATDSAALAGVGSISTSNTAARNAAIATAALNNVYGTPLVVQSADVLIGKWSTTTLTLDTSSAYPDAVQVTGYRTTARGNPIYLMFAKLIGMPKVDLTCVSIAKYTPTLPYGITGINQVYIHHDLLFASYNSGVTTTPTDTAYNSAALVASNGIVGNGADHNSDIKGDINKGPSGTLDANVTVTGFKNTLTSAITWPAPSMVIVTNPGSIPVSYKVSGGVTASLPGGTYYFTKLELTNNSKINFTGPATVYLDGNGVFNDGNQIIAYNNVPANLVIYQSAGNTFDFHDDAVVCGVYIGPGSDVIFNNDTTFYGAIMSKTVKFHDRGDIFCDEAVDDTQSSMLVK